MGKRSRAALLLGQEQEQQASPLSPTSHSLPTSNNNTASTTTLTNQEETDSARKQAKKLRKQERKAEKERANKVTSLSLLLFNVFTQLSHSLQTR